MNQIEQDITHVIQLATAPVFLLSSLAAFLSVLSARLGRIVDRARVLHDRRETADEAKRKKIDNELALLVERRHIVNRAITAATISALLVCVVIAVAFVASFVQLHSAAALAIIFVVAMLAYITSLVAFLREVIVASRSTHIELHTS